MTWRKITITQVHKCMSVHQSSYQDQSNSILIKVIIKAHFDQDQRTGWSVWLGTMATWPRRASSRYSSHPTSSWRLSTRTRMGLSRRWMWCVVWISIKLVVRVDFHFIHDVPDNSFSPEMRTSYLFSDFTLKVVHFVTIYQTRNYFQFTHLFGILPENALFTPCPLWFPNCARCKICHFQKSSHLFSFQQSICFWQETNSRCKEIDTTRKHTWVVNNKS